MRKIYFLITQYLLFAIRFFYCWLNGGINCVVCGRRTLYHLICKNCDSKYFSVKKSLSISRCNICGKELISTFGICSDCKENIVLKSVDKAIPLYSYRLWNKELLFRWKISGERLLSSYYAKKVSEVLKTFNINYVVPVPPRKGKIKKNGWDQIDELCQFLKYKYGYKVLKLLERNSTVQQKKLNRVERLETIKSAYSLVDYKDVLPESVCLIDDVCTTGSTIECCAALLKSAGIKKVFVITLYIVD